jgi:CBS domain-containing protein
MTLELEPQGATTMNTHIKRILHAKGDAVFGVTLRSSVSDAIRTMAEHKAGSVLVFDDKRIVGILTERDLVHRVLFEQRDPATTPTEVVMTAPVAYVSPESTVADAMKVMAETHCRHLPVMVEDRVIGIVSLGDLIRQITGDLETQIMYLESYIRGR